MIKRLLTQYPESFFLLKLLLLFSVFYYGTQFWIGITSKGNLYIAFCDNYLNYFVWLRIAILKLAGFFCYLLGYNTTIEYTTSLRIIGGIRVNVVQSCVGVGILSAWSAFILAYPEVKKSKFIWLLSGLFTIYVANSIRIAALLILVNKTKDVGVFPYHHTLYNIVSYIIIFLLIYFYTKEKRSS